MIIEWIGNRSLPLLVRKFNKNRGSVIQGSHSRKFIPVDNSPAQWMYATACDNLPISLADIRPWLENGTLPVAMILSASERRQATYRGTLDKALNTQKLGWKLAHIEQIGKGLSKVDIAACDESFMEEHFRKLMSPGNMFVIPKEYALLAENTEFLHGFISQTKNGFTGGGNPPPPPPLPPAETVLIKRIPVHLRKREHETIQKFMQYLLRTMFDHNLIPNDEIRRMLNREYCVKTFGIQFPIIQNEESNIYDDAGHCRYWISQRFGKNDKYWACSQWWKQREKEYEENLATWVKHIERLNKE